MIVSSEVEHDPEILCCGCCGGGQAALPGMTTCVELKAPNQPELLVFEGGVLNGIRSWSLVPAKAS